MLGWCADLFRLAWGLVYWNTRKAWFQARRGKSPCPCQSRSDSGRAFETQCEACISWHRPGRFRRVCPLLVETKDGLRCSADTADVRPFWGRALAHYGAAAGAVYVAGVLGVFVFLRSVGYPVSIVHVGLPPLWPRVAQARGWFFLEKANQAFAADRTAEGLLYLANAYDFDPANYTAGLLLAKNYQVGQAARSDQIFRRLLRDHPARRHATAQDWFRALLARGSFELVAGLAQDELLTDPDHAGVWMRALVFAARRLPDDTILRELASDERPAARRWRPLVATELLIRAGRLGEARAAVEQPWEITEQTRFSLYYRVQTLVSLGDSLSALDLLEKHAALLDAETRVTLRLEAFAARGSEAPLQAEVGRLLGPRLTPATLSVVKVLCAQLIRFPDPDAFGQLWEKVDREQMPLNTETAGLWFSLLCSAGAVGDADRLHELTARLKNASQSPFLALGVVEAFFRGQTSERQIGMFLPILPLPLEVTYALHERYGAPPVVTLRPGPA